MGTSNPYLEVIPPDPPPNEIFPFSQLFGDSPMYINGQRVSCTLDGMSIGCGQAMSMLDHGSAIPAALAPFQNLPGFQFNSNGLGLFTVNIPGHYFSTPSGPNSGEIIRVGSYGYQPATSFSFSLPFTNVSWRPPLQNQGGGGGGRDDGGGKGGPKAKLPDAKKVDKCLKKQFGKTAFLQGAESKDSTIVTTIGLNGSFFSVTTNLNRFSAGELGRLDANQNRVKYTGWIQSGFTTGNNPTNNDIAREVAVGAENGTYNSVGSHAVFYHELGNAIAGKIYLDQYRAAKTDAERDKLADPFRTDTPATDSGDRDSGTKLERCLFGGIVGLTNGQVGNGRNW